MTTDCSVPGCSKPIRAGGWCVYHYDRNRLHGDPNAPFKNARKGEGHLTKAGYRSHFINGKHKYEHILVAERALGRKLPRGAVVHHVNENRSDNRPENLVICPSRAYHNLIHKRMDALAATGNPNLIKCCYCHQWDTPEAVPERTDGHRSRYHKRCHLAWMTRRQKEKRDGIRPSV